MSVEQQAADAESAPEPAFSAVLPTADLRQFVDTIAAVADEAVLAIDDDGLGVSLTDPGNVRMVLAQLGVGAFEQLDTTGVRLGVSLGKLDDALGYCDGASVSLEYDPETGRLSLTCDAYEVELGLVDTDAIRASPDPDDLPDPGPAGVTLAGDAFDRAIRAPGAFADRLRFIVDQESGEFIVEGTADITNSRVRYPDGDCAEWSVNEDAASLFSFDQLDAIRPVVPDVPVRVAVGTEYPLFIAYETDHLDVEFRVAPRIEAQ